MQEHRNSLKTGYRLHWYVIKRILGQGGFGITYLAEDTNLNQEVAIKEYLPVELAVRERNDSIHPVSGEHGEQFSWGLDRFMSEAQTLAQFRHPNIVRVLAVFQENNTAYMVMEYEKGQAMHEVLKERKTLPEAELRNIFLPILDGLEQIHEAGFIHRDIKPPNIFIRADGTPVLLDFGSARQSLGERTRTLTSMVSPGFAPFEQYVSKSDKQGPWTDIYGLGATLYRSAVGRSPAEAMDRSESLLHTERDAFVAATEIRPEGYSQAFLAAIDHALAFKAEERPRSIKQWRAEFEAPPESQSTEAETVRVAPLVGTQAGESETPTTEKISIKVDEGDRTDSNPDVGKKPLSWYRKPLKVIAVLFGIFLLLAILDDNNSKDEGPDAEPGEKTSEMQQAQTETGPGDIPESARPDDVDVDKDLKDLLRNAENDISALRLTTPKGNNAVEKLRQVLTAEPDNQQAQDGLKRVAEKYLRMAEKSLQDKDVQKAANYVEKAANIDAEHPGISILGTAIANYQATDSDRDARVRDAPAQDSTDVIIASDRRKLLRLKRQLTRNPNNDQARQELHVIAGKYENLVRQAFREKDYDLAEAYLSNLLELSPDNRKLLELQNKIIKKQAAE